MIIRTQRDVTEAVLRELGRADNPRFNEIMGAAVRHLHEFWRMNCPRTANGEALVRSPTPGDPIFVNGWIKDMAGRPVAGADVDVWHTSSEGLYENQDPAQADMNLRGKFTSDTDISASAPSSRPAIRYRLTGPLAICCGRRAGTTCGRLTPIS
jgi:hypothetical protein